MVQRSLAKLFEEYEGRIRLVFKDRPLSMHTLARPTAIGLILVMLVAIAKVHGKHGFFLNFAMTPGKGHGYEFNLALIALALSILIGGAGVFSIDRLIAPLGG